MSSAVPQSAYFATIMSSWVTPASPAFFSKSRISCATCVISGTACMSIINSRSRPSRISRGAAAAVIGFDAEYSPPSRAFSATSSGIFSRRLRRRFLLPGVRKEDAGPAGIHPVVLAGHSITRRIARGGHRRIGREARRGRRVWRARRAGRRLRCSECRRARSAVRRHTGDGAARRRGALGGRRPRRLHGRGPLRIGPRTACRVRTYDRLPARTEGVVLVAHLLSSTIAHRSSTRPGQSPAKCSPMPLATLNSGQRADDLSR